MGKEVVGKVVNVEIRTGYPGCEITVSGSQSGEVRKRIGAGHFALHNFRSLFLDKIVEIEA